MAYDVRRGTAIVPASDTVTSGTNSEIINGELSNLFFAVPALEGTGTATLVAVDDLGGTVYASTPQAESGTARIAPIGTPTHFGGTLELRVTTTNATDGTQSVARNIPYRLYYRGQN